MRLASEFEVKSQLNPHFSLSQCYREKPRLTTVCHSLWHGCGTTGAISSATELCCDKPFELIDFGARVRYSH
jgi:hypothetical protein